jgi:phenylacetate-CoA ligase
MVSATGYDIYAATPEQLAQFREEAFARTMDRVFAAHPYYQRVFKASGLARDDIRSLRDLSKIPITTKADFMAAPQQFCMGPEGALDDSETVVWQVMYTTGSSGAPSPFVMTSYDYISTLAQKRNMLRIRGVTEKDSLLSLFPLTKYPHGAYLGGVNTSPAFSIPVTIALPGRENERHPEIGSRLDEVVAIAGRTKATILQGVPTYIRKVVGRAQELQVNLPETRQVWVTGEGLGDEARADLIARLKLLGARDPEINVAYGLSEIQGGLVECAHGFGYHNPSPDQFLFECVDADTRMPVADGEEGLILLSHLDRRGTVLLRYAVGDMARVTSQRCPNCGMLTERIISMPHRFDGLVKIKGMLVNPLLLVDAIMGERDIVEFQAFVDKEDPTDSLSMDRLLIKLVPKANADGDINKRVLDRVRRAVSVTPLIEITTSDDPALKSRGWKTKPLIDLRAPTK